MKPGIDKESPSEPFFDLFCGSCYCFKSSVSNSVNGQELLVSVNHYMSAFSEIGACQQPLTYFHKIPGPIQERVGFNFHESNQAVDPHLLGRRIVRIVSLLRVKRNRIIHTRCRFVKCRRGGPITTTSSTVGSSARYVSR